MGKTNQKESQSIIPNFVSVDAGKSFCKFAKYLTDGTVGCDKFKTKMTPNGSFDNNQMQGRTFTVQVDDGDIYTYGTDGAQAAPLETSKLYAIHKIGFYSALGIALPEGNQQACVSVSVPFSQINDPETVNEYIRFFFEEKGKEHKIRIKTKNFGPEKVVYVKFENAYIFPESTGAVKVYADRPEMRQFCGILDNGHRNSQFIYTYNCGDIRTDMSSTTDTGGAALLQMLKDGLSRRVNMRVDDTLLIWTLKKNPEERFLVPNNGNESVMKVSKEVFDAEMRQYAETLKGTCNSLRWPIDFMPLICIGGTSKLVSNELKKVFGEHIIIPQKPEYIHTIGSLMHMCSSYNLPVKSIRKELLGDEF